MLQKALKSFICLLLLFVFCLPRASFGQTGDTAQAEQPKSGTSQTVSTDNTSKDDKLDSQANTQPDASVQAKSMSTSSVSSTGTTTSAGGSMLNPILNKNLAGELTKYNSMEPFNTGEVDASGAFNYSYPIKLPPGTNGMEPKLALFYNSNSDNGMLGMGWSLDGIPAITRDASCGITFDDTKDHYLYEGEKLVYADPAKGGDGYYHTERESFVRFKLEYPNASNSYWVMTLKNGIKMYFGYQASEHTCQTDGHVDAAGKGGKALLWSLSKVIDVQGNYYVVEYNEDVAGGDYYPVRITYTKNEIRPLSAYKTIEFSYESRSDHWSIYVPTKVDMDGRLKWVTVKVGGNLLKKYRLDYEYGVAAGRSRLITIQEYGGDGNTPPETWVDGSYIATGRTLPPQTFKWQEGGNGTFTAEYYQPAPGNGIAGQDLKSVYDRILAFDYNGDGKSDLCIYRPGSGAVSIAKSNGDGTFTAEYYQPSPGNGIAGSDLKRTTDTILPLDYNGDGKNDLCIYRPGKGAISIAKSNGNGTFTVEYYQPEPGNGIAGQDLKSVYDRVFAFDYNGDGKDDLCIYRPGSGAVSIAKSNGDGTFTAEYYQPSPGNGIAGSDLKRTNDTILPLDYNGDGKSDLCIYRPGSGAVSIAKSNGDGTFTVEYCQPEPGNGIAGSDLKRTNDTILPLDYNGDGKSDLCIYRPGSGAVSIAKSNGDGTFTVEYCQPEPGSGIAGSDLKRTNDTISPLDYNGDGKSDLCIFRPGKGAISIAKSNGNGTFTVEYCQPEPGNGIAGSDLKSTSDTILPFDYNGDGKSDLCIYRPGSGAVSIAKSNGFIPDILNLVSNNFGLNISINYLPTPQVSNAVISLNKAYPNIANSSPRPLVTKISVKNGLTGDFERTINTSYQYSDGVFHQGFPHERASLGFAWIKKIDENTGNTEITYYHQDDPDYRGLILKKEQLGPGGQKFLETRYEYAKSKVFSNIDGIKFVSTTDEYLFNYNGDETGDPVQYHISYTYDNYGNITERNDQGDISVITDDTRETTQYEINTADWVMLPAVKQLYARKLDGSEGLAAETRYTYTNYLPTREERENGENDVILTYGYDEYGNRTSVTDGNNRTTTTLYDGTYHTLVWKVTNPLNQTVETVYDDLLRPVRIIDLNGVVWETVYDEFSREIKTIAPGDDQDQPTVRRSYPDQFPDGGGNPIFPQRMQIEKKGVNGDYLQCYIYLDGLNRVIQEKTEARSGWDTVDYIYDNSGRRYKVSMPYLTTSFEYSDPDTTVASRWEEYDPLNRVTVVHHSDTTTSQYVYGKYDTLTVDRNGHVTNKRIVGNTEETIAYLGVYPSHTEYARTTKLTAADGIRVTDALGNVFLTSLDMLGRKVQTSDPVQGTWSYVYDGNGNLVQYTDARNQTIILRYDAVNRLIEKEYPNGSKVNLYYDETGHGYSTGRLTGASYPGGGESYEYDARGRKISQTQTIDGKSRTQSFTYDSMDRVLTQTYPDGEVVNYTYEENGNLKTLAGETAYVSDIGYSPLCKVNLMVYGNGVQTLYDYYDTAGETDPSTGKAFSYRLRQIRVSGSMGDLLNLEYQYDKASNVTVKQDRLNSNLTENYSYDELDRLTGANSAVYGNKFYRYNQINNILEKDTRVYQYDVAHPYAVVNDGRYTYTYDANGNIVGRSDGRVITWDYDNRVASISDGGSFVYDVGFRRIKKVENGKTTLYFFKEYEEEYQGGELSKATKYYFANDMRVAENSGIGGLRFYHQDHLSSSSAVTDVSGNLVLRQTYLPYGGVAYTQGNGEVRYTFTGKELDDSDWFYFGARYYDPELGRFMSVDPAKDGGNWYAYCNDNPVKYIDPTGLWSFSSMCSSISKSISSACSSVGKAVSSAYSAVSSAVGKAVSAVTGGGKNGGKTSSGDGNKTEKKTEEKTQPSATIGPQPPGYRPSSDDDYGPKNGYADINFSFGTKFFVGFTAGLQYDEHGFHPYLGVGICSRGPSTSITVGDIVSDSGVGHGWNVGLQGTATFPTLPIGPSGQVGYNFQSGAVFGEGGFGGPTGGGLFGYYVW